MDWIRSWLIGVTCAAIIIAVADSLTPPGTVKKLGRLTGGVVLMLAMVKPLAALDYNAMAAALAEYRWGREESVQAGSGLGDDLMKDIIEERTGAYILDKAAELNIVCTGVEVLCQTGEGGLPYPAEVTVWGVQSREDQAELSRSIEGELAIPVQQQRFESGDVE